MFPENGREWGIAGASGLLGGLLTVLIPWGIVKIFGPKAVAPAVEAPKTGTAG